MTEYVLTLAGPDRVGIVHRVSGVLVEHEANIIDSQQFGDPGTERFFMRVHFDAEDHPELRGDLAGVAADLGMEHQVHDAGAVPRIVVLVSAEGHCLNDLIYRTQAGTVPATIAAVVSNHRHLEEMAQRASIPFHHLPVSDTNRADQEDAVLRIVEASGAELVVLARYMQILSPSICAELAGRIINIHHSFLPSFQGAHPYRQAHQRGVKVIGATAHYVTPTLDAGPIIEQEVERVDHTMTPARLAAIGRDVECVALARAVHWHVEHRVFVNGDRTIVFR